MNSFNGHNNRAQSGTPRLSPFEKLILEVDATLRTLHNIGSDTRPSPAADIPEADTDAASKRHSAALMRVNHSGEICAQALYRGQALTARDEKIRTQLIDAGQEEVDHLAWCAQRLDELNSHTSYLNPLWYGLSWIMGVGAGLAGDKLSLGWLAATEDQVAEHLQDHLERLPAEDQRSRAIVEKMLEEEQQHGEQALESGGLRFSRPVRKAMRWISGLMTWSSYRI